MADFETIKNARDTASAALAKYEGDLLRVFNPLRNRALNTGLASLTQAERANYDLLGPALDEVHHAMYTLALVTLQAINQSHEVRDIVASLEGITGDLKKTAANLTAVADAVNTAASIVASIASVVVTLAPLL